MSAKILITGASGQIGTELVSALRDKYGVANVIASDIHDRSKMKSEGPCYTLDVLNKDALEWLIETLGITQIYHLAAVLSATGEKNPVNAWDLNMRGLLNVLDVARKHKVERVFWPSSIAVFGPGSMPAVCFQNSKADPTTVYGISKLAGEYWCRYYNENYGMDIRSLRYPGLIGYSSLPGGGTTDYAVDIFHKALSEGKYECFLRDNTCLPMMYMDDAIRATLELMDAPKDSLTIRDSYNVAAMSFTPKDLAAEISRQRIVLTVNYVPDHRQAIADSWPQSINDRQANQDWGWKPQYDLTTMVADMLHHLKQKRENMAEALKD
jgi:nucleoside-diphosphate-sugar epimerase